MAQSELLEFKKKKKSQLQSNNSCVSTDVQIQIHNVKYEKDSGGGGKRIQSCEDVRLSTAGREGEIEGRGRKKEAEIMFMKRPHYVTL